MHKSSNKQNLHPNRHLPKPQPKPLLRSASSTGKSKKKSKIMRTRQDSSQRQLHQLKKQVKRMQKEVEIFKSYYLTMAESNQTSQWKERQMHHSQTAVDKCTKTRNTSSNQDYLINSTGMNSRQQADYYIQYYLNH